MIPEAWEVNFDGMVGPSHNFAGFGLGNIKSAKNRGKPSNPKKAALQGLRKMHSVFTLGVRQAVLPPQERPDLEFLRSIGFFGKDEELVARAAQDAPAMLRASYSAASMWTANAATVTPSADSADSFVHFTPANLGSQLHRHIEARTTANILKSIFSNNEMFSHHKFLPGTEIFNDEGAANHTRFCTEYGAPGLHVFVYGWSGHKRLSQTPRKFRARQSLEASEAIARVHRLGENTVLFLQQSPSAVDAGVFHNDVIAVGDRDRFVYHEAAFPDHRRQVTQIRRAFERACAGELRCFSVSSKQLPLRDAVESYLFNSQIVVKSDGSRCLVAPIQAKHHSKANGVVQHLVDQHVIDSVEFVDITESVRNGGGPACLRLRVVLTERELSSVHQGCIFTPELHAALTRWVEKHYRDRLEPADLADKKLITECQTALDELSGILGLGPIYSFQRMPR